MGIQKITLGPKSKMADDLVEAAAKKSYDAVVAQVKAGQVGCGCGQQLLSTRDSDRVVDGVVHRHGLPCYRRGESKQLGALPAAATPEPPPAPGRGNVLDDLVVLLRERSDFGLRKYGTRLEAFNGRDAHLDALQELLDLFVYQHQAAMERAALEAEVVELRAKVAAACCGKGGCSR